MRQFLWKGSKLGQRCGLLMVSWDVVCIPSKTRGLGFLDAQTMNMALLKKWVARLIS